MVRTTIPPGIKTLGFVSFVCIISFVFVLVAEAYALAPAAAYEHLIGHYSKYLSHKSLKNPEKYYINRFEAFRHGDHDESDDDDGPDESDGDYYIPPIQGEVDEPVGDLEELVKEYGEQYLKYLELERAEEASAFRTDASLQIL